jgi:hypothetical protein
MDQSLGTDWRERLRAEIDARKDDGVSMRGVSLAAGFGPGYVQSLFGTENIAPKEPSVGY